MDNTRARKDKGVYMKKKNYGYLAREEVDEELGKLLCLGNG